MDKAPIFQITSTMEKEDYRNFLYLTTFKNADSVIGLLLLSLLLGFAGSMVTTFSMGNVLAFSLIFFLVFFSLMTAKVESRVKQSYRLDQPGDFEKEQTIFFYEEYLTATNRANAGATTVSYENIYKVFENHNYIIIYLDKELASMIRKKDLEPETTHDLTAFLSMKIKDCSVR